MARVPFSTVFRENKDGSLDITNTIRCGGVTVTCGGGDIIKQSNPLSLFIGGVDFYLFKGRDLEIETDGDTIVIKGIYQFVGG